MKLSIFAYYPNRIRIQIIFLIYVMNLRKLKLWLFGERVKGEKIKKPSFKTTIPTGYPQESNKIIHDVNDWFEYIHTTTDKRRTQ